MSFLNWSRKKIILGFILGLLIFTILIPSFFYLKSGFLQTNNDVARATVNNNQSTISIGTGLSGIADWSTQLPFLDIFKSSRKWITQCGSGDPGCNDKNSDDTNEYNLLKLDENGWVKSLPTPKDAPIYTRVSSPLFTGLPSNRYPSGKYIVLYDGEGTIEYGYNSQLDKAASIPGRDVIDVKSVEGIGIFITITSTDPRKTGNYIRNIRVVQAKHEKNFKEEIFNIAFTDKLKNFKAIRFMDWMATNNSEQKEWVNRPKLANFSYAIKGVPIEIMVALSNKVKAKPWFNMPHRATDEYITNFARMVKDGLDARLKVYVEYSNEVWNDSFGQGGWVEEQGTKEWFDKSESVYTKRLNWHGKRTAQMCDIWKGVFGTQRNRVVCVLGSQAVNSWTAIQALDCPLWKQGPCSKHGIDVVAIAPYFGGYLGDPSREKQVQKLTLSQLFQEIERGGVLAGSPAGGAIQESDKWMKENMGVAKQKNMQLIAYEGGQHLVGALGVENNQTITNLFIAANRDRRMYDVYINYLNRWKNSGGTLFMHYVDISQHGKWGSFGALEYVDQSTSPKYNALIDFIKNN